MTSRARARFRAVSGGTSPRLPVRSAAYCGYDELEHLYDACSELSLIGLTGGGSIPLGIACLGGVLTFLGLWALGYVSQLPHKRRRKEAPMEQTGRSCPGFWFRATKSVTSTLWAIGTGISAGALSG